MRQWEHRLAVRLRRRPRIYALLRSLRHVAGDILPPKHVEGIGLVHRNDLMFAQGTEHGVAHYLEAGEQAVKLCKAALEASDRHSDEASSILDFGCGHGRCLRALRSRWTNARIVATDLDRGAVRFCAQTFEAVGIPTRPGPPAVPTGPFDLAWVGSVLTHIPLDTARVLLRDLATAVPDGVVVVTTHAPHTLDNLLADEDDIVRTGVAAEIQGAGFAFQPSRSDPSYGLSWFTPERFRVLTESAGLSVLSHWPATWLGHQDVWALASKRDATPSRSDQQ